MSRGRGEKRPTYLTYLGTGSWGGGEEGLRIPRLRGVLRRRRYEAKKKVKSSSLERKGGMYSPYPLSPPLCPCLGRKQEKRERDSYKWMQMTPPRKKQEEEEEEEEEEEQSYEWALKRKRDEGTLEGKKEDEILAHLGWRDSSYTEGRRKRGGSRRDFCPNVWGFVG